MSLPRRVWLAGSLAAASLGACSPGPRAASGAKAPPRPPPAPARPQRILILGGTGFVGPAIVEAALARGHAVTLFNRGQTDPGRFPGLETVVGDRLTDDFARLRGRDWDAVVDTWGPGPTLVRRAAEALRERAGQFVFVSTISVYRLGREPIDERSPVLAPPPGVEVGKPVTIDETTYGPLKAMAERAAEAAMPGRATVVRAGLLVGPGDPSDRFVYWPLRLARGGEVLAPGAPSDPAQFLDVRDLGAWVVTTVERRAFGVYNAVGPRDPAFGASLASMNEAIGAGARVTWVEHDWLERHDAGGWGDFPVAVRAGGETAGFARVSAARAIAEGLTLRSPGETARDALAWWRALPAERRAKERPGVSDAREAELLALWRAGGGRRG